MLGVWIQLSFFADEVGSLIVILYLRPWDGYPESNDEGGEPPDLLCTQVDRHKFRLGCRLGDYGLFLSGPTNGVAV